MPIHNKRLKAYIYNNTKEIIRSRADDCNVMEIEIGLNQNSLTAIVNGSSGIPYQVHFSGLLFGKIKSSCSCPFDHGNVCKHQVALANETESYFSEKEQNLKEEAQNEKNTKETAYSTTDPYVLKIQPNDSIDDLIRLNTSKTAYNSQSSYHPDTVTVSFLKNNYIDLIVKNNYWDYEYHNVQIRKKEKELILLCNCRALNKNLCKHQIKALTYLEQTPDLIFLKSEAEIEEFKENALNQYGFTLKDSAYEKYFSFEIKNGAYVLKEKKEGLLRLSQFKDYKSFNYNFLDSDAIIKKQLAITKKEIAPKKNKGFAIALGFYDDFQGDLIDAYAIIGNLSKDLQDLTTKLEVIDIEDFVLKTYDLTDHQSLIAEKTIQISNTSEKNNDENHERERTLFQQLKKLISLLNEKVIVYNFLEGDYSNLKRKQLKKINIETENPRLFFKVVEESHFYVLQAYVEVAGKKKKIKRNQHINDVYFFKMDTTYYLYKSFYEGQTFVYFNQNPELRIPKNDFTNYYQEFIRPLSERFEVIIKHQKRKKKTVDHSEFKKQVYLTEIEDTVIIKPIIEYANKQIEVLSLQTIEEKENDILFTVKREKDFEDDFIETIQSLHPNFKTQDETFFHIETENFLKDTWFLDAFETLNKNKIEVFGFEKLSKIKYNMHKPSISVNVSSGIDWFDVKMEVSFGDQEVSLKDIKKSILNKDNYIQLKDGTVGILPQEWIDKYSVAFKNGDVKKNSINVSKYQLSVIDSLYDNLDVNSEIAINHKKIKERLTTFKEIENVKKPRGLKATLRDYQKEGLNWLNFLDEYNFGGCLADDMGLGKTLQIITFLKHLKETKKPKNATLIVLPTSLIFNWQEEVNKFAPSLKYLVHTGTKRGTNISNFKNYDIVFTTYGIAMRDINILKDYTFNYCILDESQAIKNPNSQRFKSAKLLNSNNKLVLTGTPIENNTFDLYAQMSFVNPGLLNTMANFKKEYATPIDKNKDIDAANDLRHLINPFLLRRTKEQVAKELPPKTEQVLYCTMEKEQQNIYDAYKNKYKDYLLNKVDEDGLGKSKMYVLEGLTKLRQICDSPLLLNDNEKYASESVKIKELLKHVVEKTGKHKILIFSQFVKMLDLVKAAFNKENIEYEYLDGKTKDRQAKVDNFQNNENVRVFLISLKAGGTGLNLTAADYVYLMDPWWNPAVEAQAIDRCYRIGQTKKVMAYKMICKGTIEEKIMKYQEGKKQLSADIIQTDESFVKALSKESIADLFN